LSIGARGGADVVGKSVFVDETCGKVAGVRA
jgi:hypothetical protein